MAHQNPIHTELNALIRSALKEACLQVMSDEDVWSELNKCVQEWLDKSEARLSFFDGEPIINLSLGEPFDSPTMNFPIKFVDIETYVNAHPDSGAQVEMEDQVSGIDAMIAQLTKYRGRLMSKIKANEATRK